MMHGLGLYVRRISRSRHGTPAEFAKKCADHGLRWIALGGLWQDEAGGKPTSKMINSIKTIHDYGRDLEARGVRVFVWGYPWLGREAAFVDRMLAAAAPFRRILLDPELGANPSRSSRGIGKERANIGAKRLVELFAESKGLDVLGLSTFGSGWRMGWFPLEAYTRALVERFGGRCFIGGQTYTDDAVIDGSIAGFAKVIEKVGGVVMRPSISPGPRWGVEIVPNFGTYTWQAPNGKRGKRVRGAKAKPKTVAELRAHLFEFVDEDEPVDAMIGWAENFLTAELWLELKRAARLLERGAFRL